MLKGDSSWDDRMERLHDRSMDKFENAFWTVAAIYLIVLAVVVVIGVWGFVEVVNWVKTK